MFAKFTIKKTQAVKRNTKYRNSEAAGPHPFLLLSMSPWGICDHASGLSSFHHGYFGLRQEHTQTHTNTHKHTQTHTQTNTNTHTSRSGPLHSPPPQEIPQCQFLSCVSPPETTHMRIITLLRAWLSLQRKLFRHLARTATISAQTIYSPPLPPVLSSPSPTRKNQSINQSIIILIIILQYNIT